MLSTLLLNKTRSLATFEDLIQKSTEPKFGKVPWTMTYLHQGHVFHRYNPHPQNGWTLPSLCHVLIWWATEQVLWKQMIHSHFLVAIRIKLGLNKRLVLPTFYFKSLPEILILLPPALYTMHRNTLMTVKNQKSIGPIFRKTQPYLEILTQGRVSLTTA